MLQLDQRNRKIIIKQLHSLKNLQKEQKKEQKKLKKLKMLLKEEDHPLNPDLKKRGKLLLMVLGM